MGNLLKILLKDDGSRDDAYDKIFVDFEKAEPREEEKEVWDKTQAVLLKGQSILKELQNYTGATDHIRQAIMNPKNEELQEKAWQAVSREVNKLKEFYEFSLQLEEVVNDLLKELCCGTQTARQHLETQQALFKQFAEILDFVLRFDDLKMTNPSIQNDFSYYRRTQSRTKMANESTNSPDDTEENCVVTKEMANRMSLFYAEAMPMLKTVSESTTKFVSAHKEMEINTTPECLSTMADICRVMIECPDLRSRFQSEENTLFCLRVMVAVIVLYDHVHPLGAFVKSSGIDIKSSIKVLQEQEPVKVEGLLNTLRYSTKHVHEESTPKGVKSLLGILPK